MAKKTTTKNLRAPSSRVSVRHKSTSRTNREQKMLIAVSIMAIALISVIGVAVAAFTRKLEINGTATVSSTVWDIHFDKLLPVVIHGENAKEVTAPKITTNSNNVENTAIKDYDVILKDPGDYVEYTFDVVNGGDLDAEISAISIKTGSNLTCESTNDDDAIIRNQNACKHLRYTLKYADGTDVAIGDELVHDKGSNSKTMKLKLQFGETTTVDAADLPNQDVKVSGLDVVVLYSQKEEATN